ncbi:DUF6879 family protein [Streptomyces sp. BE303]|uniref:DUF6879 family protein n=1 Tax=Streptomyces sp. BE303 TaxID=3002528 RepID=UPI002E769F1D|nr:DUF6879 family protein [Streptomyces sp. BE303]MED7948030.1 hypothetical protein [Streptomyces sp. BE303]
MPPSAPSFAELLAGCSRSAVHFEARDDYGTNERFEAWKAGHRNDWEDRSSWWLPFHSAISDAVARGVVIRRVRVVSEPVSDYIRWEHCTTRANVEAGEQVRWLPRRQASDLLIPMNDYWAFDSRVLRVHHFSGSGSIVEDEITDFPELVKLYSDAFETIWERAIPHDQYHI